MVTHNGIPGDLIGRPYTAEEPLLETITFDDETPEKKYQTFVRVPMPKVWEEVGMPKESRLREVEVTNPETKPIVEEYLRNLFSDAYEVNCLR